MFTVEQAYNQLVFVLRSQHTERPKTATRVSMRDAHGVVPLLRSCSTQRQGGEHRECRKSTDQSRTYEGTVERPES